MRLRRRTPAKKQATSSPNDGTFDEALADGWEGKIDRLLESNADDLFKQEIDAFRLTSEEAKSNLQNHNHSNLPFLQLTLNLVRSELDQENALQGRKAQVINAVQQAVFKRKEKLTLPPFCDIPIHPFLETVEKMEFSSVDTLDILFEAFETPLERALEDYRRARENMKGYEELLEERPVSEENLGLGELRDKALKAIVDLLLVKEAGLTAWSETIKRSIKVSLSVEQTNRSGSFFNDTSGTSPLATSISNLVDYNISIRNELEALTAEMVTLGQALKGDLQKKLEGIQRLQDTTSNRLYYYHETIYGRRVEASNAMANLNLLTKTLAESKDLYKKAKNAFQEFDDSDYEEDESDLEYVNARNQMKKCEGRLSTAKRKIDGLLEHTRHICEEEMAEGATSYSFFFPEILAQATHMVTKKKRSEKPVIKMLRRHGLLVEGRSYKDYQVGDEETLPPLLYECVGEKPAVEGAVLKGSKEGDWKILKKIPQKNFLDIYRSVAHSNRSAHRGIVPIECVFVSNMDVVLQSRFYSGGDMRRWCKGKSDKAKLVSFFKVAEALAFLHANELVHRDIKPENIVFDGEGPDAHPAFCDFDLSKDTNNLMTTKGNAGSWLYMPPESASTNERDVFSLGITMLDILGCGGEPANIPILRQSGRVDSKAALEMLKSREGCLPRVHSLIHCMVDPSPENRPTARQVFAEMQELVNILNARECNSCMEQFSNKMVICESAPSGSGCLCSVCFELYVANEKLTLKNRQIRCFNKNRCSCEPYTPQFIANLVSTDVYENYVSKWRNIIEAEVAQELNATHEEDLKRLMKKSYEELQIMAKRKELEDVLNLRCPKCHAAFVDYDGCAALTCRCGAHFCALCQVDCGADAHAHVPNCELNPSRSVYVSTPVWKQIVGKQNRVKLRALWNSFSENMKTQLSKNNSVRQLFQDLKIEMPGIKQYGAELAQLRGMGFRDEEDAFAALTKSDGDVEKAVELLLKRNVFHFRGV